MKYKWYYFQTEKDGPVIRVKSKQMPKNREKSYIVHEYYPDKRKYVMACFPEIHGKNLLKMIYIGKHNVEN